MSSPRCLNSRSRARGFTLVEILVALLILGIMSALGYNTSAVHTDVVSTSRREVTAHLPGGGTRVIYRDGQFVI